MTARSPNLACSASNMAMPVADPKTLVMWEAQFGDFRQRRADHDRPVHRRGEAKWLRANGLVMLLPHGYEGQGPEHSSARLERFLQLCAEDNIQVANMHHARQLFPRAAPPDAARVPQAVDRHDAQIAAAAQAGSLESEDFQGESHFMRILSDPCAPPTRM
jgi:2-oxoglutarate dehydrogenase E1 component